MKKPPSLMNHDELVAEVTSSRRTIAQLREALATAGAPLEAIFIAGSDIWHSRTIRTAIHNGRNAVRVGLGMAPLNG